MCARWWLKFMFGLVFSCGLKGHHECSGLQAVPTEVQMASDKLPVYESLPPGFLGLPADCSSSWLLDLHSSPCWPGTFLLSPHPPPFSFSKNTESASLMFWISLTFSSTVSWRKPSISRDLVWHHWACFKLSWLLSCLGESFVFLLIKFSSFILQFLLLVLLPSPHASCLPPSATPPPPPSPPPSPPPPPFRKDWPRMGVSKAWHIK